jgi:TonB family protein
MTHKHSTDRLSFNIASAIRSVLTISIVIGLLLGVGKPQPLAAASKFVAWNLLAEFRNGQWDSPCETAPAQLNLYLSYCHLKHINQIVGGVIPNQVPEATLPCTPDEAKWWNRLREAAQAAAEAGKPLERARNDARLGRSSLAPKEVAKLNEAFAAATSVYLGTLRDGLVNSYHVPIANKYDWGCPPIILFRAKAKFPEDALRIQGTVTLSAVFRADGQVANMSVIRSLKGRYDDMAIEAASQIIFLPAVKDGRFVNKRLTLEYSFNLY